MTFFFAGRKVTTHRKSARRWLSASSAVFLDLSSAPHNPGHTREHHHLKGSDLEPQDKDDNLFITEFSISMVPNILGYQNLLVAHVRVTHLSQDSADPHAVGSTAGSEGKQQEVLITGVPTASSTLFLALSSSPHNLERTHDNTVNRHKYMKLSLRTRMTTCSSQNSALAWFQTSLATSSCSLQM